SLTYMQAFEACRASGKRLPSGEEWLAAASGTPDPGASDGTGGTCVTGGALRATGGGTMCRSAWGAEDMIGNLWEVTNEWFAAVGNMEGPINPTSPWPAGFGDGQDATWNVDSTAYVGGGVTAKGMPVVALRGGNAAVAGG